jgi:phage terminase large subunit-like protein
MIDALAHLPFDDFLSSLQDGIAYQQVEDHIAFKQYKPNPKQLTFHSTGLIAKERAFFAGNRCGKSLCVSAEWSMHLTGNYPEWWNGFVYKKPINIWVAGVTNAETYQSLKRYYIGDIEQLGFIHPSLIVRKEPQKHLYYIQHSSGGVSKLRFKSYEQGEDAWQAETLDGIHLDEEPPSKIYSEAITRTASTGKDHHGMITLSMTPLKGVTTLMLKYMQASILDENGNEIETRTIRPEEVNNSRVYMLASHADAPHITDEERKRLYASYSPHEIEARTKGIPSLGSGLVYPVHESKIVCSPFQIPDYWPRCFGLDFGWHHPTAAVFIAHDQDNDIVYIYGEYSVSHLTPQHHAYELIRQGADWMPGAYDHAGESANQVDGSNVVDLYQRSGMKYLIPADKRSVSKGIYEVLQRMENGKLKIFSNLHKLLTELRMYARDENGKIKKGNDDLMDAMRYGIQTALPIAKTKSSVLNRYRIPTHNVSSEGSWMIV